MKPFINIDDLEDFTKSRHGDFQERYAPISEKIGAQKLGYSLSIVPPGRRSVRFTITGSTRRCS